MCKMTLQVHSILLEPQYEMMEEAEGKNTTFASLYI